MYIKEKYIDKEETIKYILENNKTDKEIIFNEERYKREIESLYTNILKDSVDLIFSDEELFDFFMMKCIGQMKENFLTELEIELKYLFSMWNENSVKSDETKDKKLSWLEFRNKFRRKFGKIIRAIKNSIKITADLILKSFESVESTITIAIYKNLSEIMKCLILFFNKNYWELNRKNTMMNESFFSNEPKNEIEKKLFYFFEKNNKQEVNKLSSILNIIKNWKKLSILPSRAFCNSLEKCFYNNLYL